MSGAKDFTSMLLASLIYYLHNEKGFKASEISRALEIKASTVRASLYKIRNKQYKPIPIGEYLTFLQGILSLESEKDKVDRVDSIKIEDPVNEKVTTVTQQEDISFSEDELNNALDSVSTEIYDFLIENFAKDLLTSKVVSKLRIYPLYTIEDCLEEIFRQEKEIQTKFQTDMKEEWDTVTEVTSKPRANNVTIVTSTERKENEETVTTVTDYVKELQNHVKTNGIPANLKKRFLGKTFEEIEITLNKENKKRFNSIWKSVFPLESRKDKSRETQIELLLEKIWKNIPKEVNKE